VQHSLPPCNRRSFALGVPRSASDLAFSNMQTTLILTEAPLATRSRVMGIVTMCIGTGPIGVLMIGILSGQTGPSVAILIMASIGLCGSGLVWRKLTKGQPKSF